MKYRDKIQLRYDFGFVLVTLVVSATLLFLSPYGKALRGIPINYDVINEEIRFTDLPPPRHTIMRSSQIRIFSKYKNFENQNIEEKLQHWENEYNERSVNFHTELKEYIINTVLESKLANSVIVDSGSHVGDTGIPVLIQLFQKGYSDAHLVAVEPDYSKCLWIKRLSLDLNKTYPGFAEHVHIVNYGLWSHEGTASLVRDKSHPGAWYVQHDDYRKREHVKKHSIQTFKEGDIKLLSISDIISPNANFVLWHLDAEGSEGRAMLGLMKVKQEPIIIFESFKKANTDFLFNKDFLKFTKGYKMIKRLPPNSDRVMIPKHFFNEQYMTELPEYV